MPIICSGLFTEDDLLDIKQIYHERAITRCRQTVCGLVNVSIPRTSLDWLSPISLSFSYILLIPGYLSFVKPTPNDVNNHTLSQLLAPISPS